MQHMADSCEAIYQLPPGSYWVFSKKESNHKPHAVRVEANYVNANGLYAKIIRKAASNYRLKHNGMPSYLTEITQRGTSVSQFQIMFHNLREMGFDETYAADLTLEQSFEYFGKFLSNLRKRYPDNWDWVAAYNAGSPRRSKKTGEYINKEYVMDIVKYYKEWNSKAYK